MYVEAPVEQVFAAWTNFRNFPRFISHIEEVRELGHGRSHWVAKGPAGMRVSWDAEITQLLPNQLLAWKSMPGAMVENAGIIRFEPGRDGGTRLSMRLSYNPQAGAIGHGIAWLFGADLKHALDEDLARMQSVLESGRGGLKPAPPVHTCNARTRCGVGEFRGAFAMAVDPVCGQTVNQDNEMSADCSGKIYYFCSMDCKLEFEDDPERYVGWGGRSHFGSA